MVDVEGRAALRRRMISIVEDVKERGVFKSRVPEGKADVGTDDDQTVIVKPDGRPRYARHEFPCHAIVHRLF